MSRYAVFIDAGHFLKALRTFGEPRIDYLKLSEKFRNQDERLRTYYYHCAPFQSMSPTDEEQKRKSRFDGFITSLESKPRFQVRLGRLSRGVGQDGAPTFWQKMVDVLLRVDLVRLSYERQIQRAVIIAGDSDYVPAIRVARDAGVIIQLCYGASPRPHDELLRACDERIIMDQEFIDSVRE